MKKLAIEDIHISLGAKMSLFAGYNMPIEYSGIIHEHINIRNNVGIFDVSHMGVIWVKGTEAFEFLQQITTNDLSNLFPGKIQYSCFPNGKGGIIDDLLIYNYDNLKYMLVVNASNIDKNWKWLTSNNKNYKVEIENSSDKTGIFAIQGPKSLDLMQKLFDFDLNELNHYEFKTLKISDNIEIILSTTGYTGETGFEIYFHTKDAENIWNKIYSIGKSFGLLPAGLAARDTLRLEKGFALYGNDIDDTTSPIEAGLGWITKFTDKNNFIDKEFLLKQKQNGIKKKLIGFELIDKGIPRKDYEIISINDEEIGKVTSGTMSPMLKKGIGMGYVNINYSKPGEEIYIQVRNKKLKAKVVSFPIYKA